MEVTTDKKHRPKEVVYVQMRQYVRDVKTKALKLITTKTITIIDATISQVEAVIRKGG